MGAPGPHLGEHAQAQKKIAKIAKIFSPKMVVAKNDR
jgi:hypothetical protein